MAAPRARRVPPAYSVAKGIQPVGLKSLRETVLTYCLLHEQPKCEVLKDRVV